MKPRIREIHPQKHERLAPTIMDVELVYEYLEELISLARTGDYDRFEVCKGMDDRLRELLDNMGSGILQDYEVRLINEIYEELQDQQGGAAPNRNT